MRFSQEYLDMCAHKLGEMVRIPSVSKGEHEDLTEFYRLHGVLEEQFPRLHEKLEKTELRGSLLYCWKSGKSLEPILLMGHQDVVPADHVGWSVGAYSGVVKDGCLYGRGALDCKGTMFTELQAIEELLEELVREHFPEAGVAPYMIMGGTDCRHFHALTDSALRFAPVRMTAEQSASCHGVDENVTVTSLAEAVVFYKDLIRRFPA